MAHGQPLPLADDDVDSTPMLSLRAMCDVSSTGNRLLSLPCPAENGASQAASCKVFFQSGLSSTQWNQGALTGAARPAGTRAAHPEIDTAAAPFPDDRYDPYPPRRPAVMTHEAKP